MIRTATLPALFLLVLMLSGQIFLDVKLSNQLAEHDLVLNNFKLRIISSSVFLALAVGYFVLLSLRLSHRVAGAAYRIRETLASFQGGDRKIRVNLRQGDFLVELADDVNSFLDWAQSEIAAPAAPELEHPARTADQVEARQDPARSAASSAS